MTRGWSAALFALLVLVAYADPLFTGRMFSGRDLIAYNHPIEKTIHDAYARGRLPSWWQDVSGGRPLLPNPNAGALYPVRPLLSLFSFPASTRIFPALHWILSGFGMMALLRCLGTGDGAAWIGAATYVFSGVGVSQNIYTNLHPGVMLLPWILWAIAREGPLPRRTILLGLLFGLDMLAGDVFTVGLALLASGLWIAVETERPWRGEAAALAGGLALGFLLAAPQVVAAAYWIPETSRAVSGLKVREVSLFSVSPFRLLELVVPYPFGPTWELDRSLLWGTRIYRFKDMGYYASLFCGVPAVVGLVARDRRVRGFRFARVLFLLCLTFSVLPSLVEGSWLQGRAPVPLRYPEKFAVGLTFALAILAALLAQRIVSGARAPRWPLGAAIIVTVAATVCWAWPAEAGRFAVWLIGAEPRLSNRASDSLAPSLAEGGLCWLAAAVGLTVLSRRRRGSSVAGLGLLSVSVLAPTLRIARTFPEELTMTPPAFARRMVREDPEGRFRGVGESCFFARSALDRKLDGADVAGIEAVRLSFCYYAPALWGRGTIFNVDVDAGDLSRMASLRRIAVRYTRTAGAGDFFGGLGLRWGTRFRDGAPLPGFREVREDALTAWDENTAARPDIRLVDRWREVSGATEALGALQDLGPGEIVLETGASRRGEARTGELRVRERSPERLVLDVQVPDPTWLFVVRGFWDHRLVVMDGHEIPCVPAQLAFSAIAVPAGEHRVEWTEKVPGLRASSSGPALFLLTSGLLLVRERRAGA